MVSGILLLWVLINLIILRYSSFINLAKNKELKILSSKMILLLISLGVLCLIELLDGNVKKVLMAVAVAIILWVCMTRVGDILLYIFVVLSNLPIPKFLVALAFIVINMVVIVVLKS